MRKPFAFVAALAAVLAGYSPAAKSQPLPDQPAPFGFKRDARGRLLQTHFDLRRRYMTGVHWAGTYEAEPDDGFASSTAIEFGGQYELYRERKSRRSRFRYLEGRLELQDLEIDALLFEYARGRRARDPVLWITTFIGEPRRYDLTLDLSPGVMLGRLWTGPINDEQLFALDIGHVHLDWEIVHGPNLEDYFALRVATGVGLRFFAGETAEAYLYPEVGARSSWLIGERGLMQWSVDARLRLAHEPRTSVTWYEARVASPFERVVLAISDQPVSIYAQPSLHYLDLPGGGRVDMRVDAGVRLSLFVPPRDPEDQCPDEAEDIDYDRDEDGCPDY